MFNIPSELIPLAEQVREINSLLSDRSKCFYCKAPSSCEDHVIPHALLNGQGVRRSGWERDTLPACHECNQKLSSKVFNSLQERAAYLAKQYRKRFARWLNGNYWTDKELGELDYSMRDAAESFNATKSGAELRIFNLDLLVKNEAKASVMKDPWDGVSLTCNEGTLNTKWNQKKKLNRKFNAAAKRDRLIPIFSGYLDTKTQYFYL